MTDTVEARQPAYVLVLTWPITTTGGVNEVVFAMAHQLRALGWRPIIAVATWSATEQPARWRGIEIVNLRLRDLAYCKGLKSFAVFAVAGLRDARALRRFIRDQNVAVLNFHFLSLVTIIPSLLWSRKLLSARLLFSFHGNDAVDISNTRGRMLRVWRYVLTHCDGVTACSEALREKVIGLFPGVQVSTVHNGVNHAEFAVPRRTGRAKPRLLQIAKFEHKKAQDILLPAFRQILDEGIEAELLMVGSSGPELDDTRRLIQKLDLTGSVCMQVDLPHDAIPDVMASADVFVLPSRKEGLPLVLLEVGVVGLPVITTPVGGIPELMADEETALLVPPGDVPALVTALRRMLTEPALADRLASAWHTKVMSSWTWEQTARGHLAAVQL